MKRVVLRHLFHRDMNCIGLFFDKDDTTTVFVKRIPGIRFSITHKCWYVPENADAAETISSHLGENVELDWSPIMGGKSVTSFPSKGVSGEAGGPNMELLRRMEEKLKLKGYSGATLVTYVSQFKLFLEFLGTKPVADATEAEIRRYLLHMRDTRKLSKSTQNQAINAIKFYFEKMLGQPRRTYYLERPMKEHRLPSILSEEEIVRIFDATENLKHKLMLMIIYSAGLRRSELLNLHVGDLDRERSTVFIRGGKGFKDRTSILAKRLCSFLDEYLNEYKPSYWLFEGVRRSRYSASSLHQVFVRALLKAGIRKDVSLHTLRHSFATHLLESGASTLYIQKLLGHESPKTTEIYAQVTKFGMDRLRSPFDQGIFDKSEGADSL